MKQFTKFTMVGALSTVMLAATVTGCSTWGHKDSQRSAGRVVDDKNITAQVETKLSNEPVYKFKDVQVRTFNGLVQLSGFATSEEQKQRAGQLASTVPGVARVVNNITLKPETTPATTGRSNSTTYPQNQNQDLNNNNNQDLNNNNTQDLNNSSSTNNATSNP